VSRPSAPAPAGDAPATVRCKASVAVTRIFLLAIVAALVTALATVPASAEEHRPASAEEHRPAKDEYAEELQGHVPGANYLEGRLRAPCCWNQTLDIHGSEISNGLKREIRRRLIAGESADAIEESIVARYGEKIRAVPPNSPLKSVATLLSLALGLAGIGAGALIVRWRRRSRLREAAEAERATGPRDEWDDRLDRELERLER
jgi:cytochrome c-type biogenesis protein CcmH